MFGREWECFSRVNASVAASVVLARRQHLVACIRPPERVHVPFPWHTAPCPPSSASLHLFRVLSARVPFPGSSPCARTPPPIPLSLLHSCTRTHTSWKRIEWSEEEEEEEPTTSPSRYDTYYNVLQPYISHFFSPEKRGGGGRKLEAGSRFPACRGRTKERPRATFCDRILRQILAQPGVQSAVEDYIPRPGYPPAVLDVHLLFAEVSHSPLRSGIVRTLVRESTVCASARARARNRVVAHVRLSTPLHPCGQTSLRASRTGVSTYTYVTHTATHRCVRAYVRGGLTAWIRVGATICAFVEQRSW